MDILALILETLKILLNVIVIALAISGEVNIFVCIFAFAAINVAHKMLVKRRTPEIKE